MSWNKIKITNKEGTVVDAIAPLIISASRSTDIPAFYSNWFLDRLRLGYTIWKNPFNGREIYISLEESHLIVFWTKNPKPLIPKLNEISEKIPNFYFQFTLNDYDKELFEPNVPKLEERIDTFIELSEKIGKDKVIWRFDPILVTKEVNEYEIIRRIDSIHSKIKNHTKKLVFSFADINSYKKVKKNIIDSKIKYIDFSTEMMNSFAKKLSELDLDLEIATCAENIDLSKYRISHNKCIDDDLIRRLFPHDLILMKYIGSNIGSNNLLSLFPVESKKLKDKGQREECNCIKSKDIGSYDTCPHLCIYCYANSSSVKPLDSWTRHHCNPVKESI